MNKITKFPNSKERRDRRNLSNNIAECEISGRWLQFPRKAEIVGGKSLMFINVMTNGQDDNPRKICELVLAKEDLLAILEKINAIE